VEASKSTVQVVYVSALMVVKNLEKTCKITGSGIDISK